MISKTKSLLSQYRDMEWKAEIAWKTIQECNDLMTRIQSINESPVQGGENHREELLAVCIDRKIGAESAVTYMRMMNTAIGQLDETERKIIMDYFVDRMGIYTVMLLCHVGRSRAYEMANDALAHLDRLLF